MGISSVTAQAACQWPALPHPGGVGMEPMVVGELTMLHVRCGGAVVRWWCASAGRTTAVGRYLPVGHCPLWPKPSAREAAAGSFLPAPDSWRAKVLEAGRHDSQIASSLVDPGRRIIRPDHDHRTLIFRYSDSSWVYLATLRILPTVQGTASRGDKFHLAHEPHRAPSRPAFRSMHLPYGLVRNILVSTLAAMPGRYNQFTCSLTSDFSSLFSVCTGPAS